MDIIKRPILGIVACLMLSLGFSVSAFAADSATAIAEKSESKTVNVKIESKL